MTITHPQELIIAGHSPCAPKTVRRVVLGLPVRPAIEARIRDVARELGITLPAPTTPATDGAK